MASTRITRRLISSCAVIASIVAAPCRAQCTEGCTVIHTFTGEAPGDQFGWISNNVGDIDRDGVDDFVITAPTNTAGGSFAGRAYVYSGATGIELFHVTGQTNWRLGQHAATAGDFNADGTLDVIVGAHTIGAGRAIVYSGVDGSVIHTFFGQAAGDQFGFRVNGGGDYNNDGIDDVLIGARNNGAAGFNAGRAYIYSGVTFDLIDVIDGPHAGANFGTGVAFVGDISQPPDGRNDIIVGAPNAGGGSVGRAYVYGWNGADSILLHELSPPGFAIHFGWSFIGGDRDIDADGTPDIYVADFNANRAHIFSGADGALVWTLTGDGGGGFGIGRLVEDLNGDGHDDMLLAAWDSNAGAPNGGKAFVYSGADATVLETFTHNVANAQFGFDANGMGDVNGDGRSDHLITAAWDSNQRGKAYLIAGSIGGLPADLNGDGTVDAADLAILLGAWGPCAPKCPTDLNGDDITGPADLAVLLGSWS